MTESTTKKLRRECVERKIRKVEVKIEKRRILDEIQRIATANGGKPPGRMVFERETGIRYSDWQPYIWLRWNEALEEAGYSPNQLSSRIDDQTIIERYISLVRENYIDFRSQEKFDAKPGATDHFQAPSYLTVLVAKRS